VAENVALWLLRYNKTTALQNGYGCDLDFLLFDVISAHEVPFCIPQYVQCILHGLTSILLCVPFIFADSESEKCNLVVVCDGFLL